MAPEGATGKCEALEEGAATSAVFLALGVIKSHVGLRAREIVPSHLLRPPANTRFDGVAVARNHAGLDHIRKVGRRICCGLAVEAMDRSGDSVKQGCDLSDGRSGITVQQAMSGNSLGKPAQRPQPDLTAVREVLGVLGEAIQGLDRVQPHH